VHNNTSVWSLPHTCTDYFESKHKITIKLFFTCNRLFLVCLSQLTRKTQNLCCIQLFCRRTRVPGKSTKLLGSTEHQSTRAAEHQSTRGPIRGLSIEYFQPHRAPELDHRSNCCLELPGALEQLEYQSTRVPEHPQLRAPEY
jgi:hypothetical protein